MTEELAVLRKGRGLSRNDLALAAGITPAWLARLEEHTAPLALDLAERLAPMLGVQAGDLYRAHAEGCERRKAEAVRRVAEAA